MTLNSLTYLVLNGFSTQGFHVPNALAGKTDLFVTGRDIVNWILAFVGTVAFLVIIWAAFTILTAAGNADKIKKAKGAITYAVIGIIIIAISYSASMYLADNLSPEALEPRDPTATYLIPLPPIESTVGYRLVTPTP